jgi:hypothetical protein
MTAPLVDKLFGNVRFKRGVDTIYEFLVNEEKIFSYQWNLFTLGLVYGILHKKSVHSKNRTGVIEIGTISDRHIQDVLCMCYLILDDGRPAQEIHEELWDYADGGVTELYNLYKESKTFNLPNLIRDSEELWSMRVKDLQNINLKK